MLDLAHVFAAFPALETARFTLREVTIDDLAAVYKMMSDKRVTRYFGRPPMTALDEAAARIVSMRNDFRDQQGVRWGIARREGGELLGTCGYWRLLKPHFRAEIGYELDPACWGQGVMPEALGAIVGYGFETMGLHSIEANIDPENTGSRRVLEKLGFEREALLRDSYYLPHEQRFSDTATYSLLRARWAAGRG